MFLLQLKNEADLILTLITEILLNLNFSLDQTLKRVTRDYYLSFHVTPLAYISPIRVIFIFMLQNFEKIVKS